MACNKTCSTAETLAGTSSLLLILADRVPRHGAASPHSFVLHDEAGQVTLQPHLQGRQSALSAEHRVEQRA